MQPGFRIHVSSETSRLRALLVHSPDSGLGKVVPSKAQDWLFEDIVYLPEARREYDEYLRLLLWFLDPAKVRGKDFGANADRELFKPGKPAFHASEAVIEFQVLLSDVLDIQQIRAEIVAAVCAIEGCTYHVQQELMQRTSADLARIIISGSATGGDMLFPPIPNLIFTRDIGVTINDCLLLSRPAKPARGREALVARYVFFNHPLFAGYRHKVIEIQESAHAFLRPKEQPEKVTLEGGDVMVVSRNHVLIGCSERTSLAGAREAMRLLFDYTEVTKVTLITIPHKRDFMHIDTLFTQVMTNAWVLLRTDQLSIRQYRKERPGNTEFDSLEELLASISKDDLGCKDAARFIYSGNNLFPFDAREQWTDSCNLLALTDGVVVGYDRNDRTCDAFRENGFRVVKAAELLSEFECGACDPVSVTQTLILVSSAELSRARGGFHCMSMPLLRED